jgi:hypothetical protein
LSPRALVARRLQEESHHDSGFLELTGGCTRIRSSGFSGV